MHLTSHTRPLRRIAVMGALLFGVGAESFADPLPPRADIPAAAKDAEPAPPPAGREPDLTLVIFDVKHQLTAEQAEMIQEVRGIFAEMGVSVGFRTGGLGTIYGDAPAKREVPIIVLDVPPGGMKRNERVLGLVPKHTAAPVVWIFAHNIRKTLEVGDAFAADSGSARDVAVAAGRVIAHEIVHALVPSLPHTDNGLMRDALSKVALRGPARPENEACVAAVQNALRVPAQAMSLPAAADARLGVPKF